MSTATNHPAVFGPPSAVAGVEVRSRSAAIPWYIWAGVLAITSSSIGGAWDVSWHRTVGRDTFWTPAHMAIYACGVLAGVICSWLIVKCTFFSRSRAQGRVGKYFWAARPARRLSCRLGRRRDAHFGTL